LRDLVVGDGFFDFKGSDGLIASLKRFMPEDHYVLATVKADRYRDHLNRLSALRNYAAHESVVSKKRALKAVRQDKIGSPGAWLHTQGRFRAMEKALRKLAAELSHAAPF
jgi:hypothetical protein